MRWRRSGASLVACSALLLLQACSLWDPSEAPGAAALGRLGGPEIDLDRPPSLDPAAAPLETPGPAPPAGQHKK